MGNFVQTMRNLPIMKFVSTIGWKFHRKSDISRKASIPLTNYFFLSEIFKLSLDQFDLNQMVGIDHFAGWNAQLLLNQKGGWLWWRTILRITREWWLFMWCLPCQYGSKIPPSPISTVIERYKKFCTSLYRTKRICTSISNFGFEAVL